MINWQYDLQRGMDLLGIMLVFSTFSNIFKAFIKPQLEKKLGRKLTDWDWQVYWQEKANRDRYTAWNKSLIQWHQQIVDQQTICEFVWNEDKGKLM